MNSKQTDWCCGKTKPKREHIAAAKVRMTPGFELFLPRFQFQRATLRGFVRIVEPVFPSCVFIQSHRSACSDGFRSISGIRNLRNAVAVELDQKRAVQEKISLVSLMPALAV